MDIDASLDIQLTKGFDVKVHFHVPSLYPDSIDIKANLEAEIAGPQVSI
jgi:hypothetical protein